MFELHITCTKDIDRIQIDLSDGTTCISESKASKTSKPRERRENEEKQSNFRDNIEHYNDTKRDQSVLEKPEVPDEPKEPHVAEYLNNLDF